MEQIAHSRTPKPIQTDFDLGYRHQQDARSARRRSPRVSCSRLNHTPIDAHRELEHEESLTRVWEKVLFGTNCNNEIDFRTHQSFSFKQIGNCGRSPTNRAVSYHHTCTIAVKHPHLIYTMYAHISTQFM